MLMMGYNFYGMKYLSKSGQSIHYVDLTFLSYNSDEVWMKPGARHQRPPSWEVTEEPHRQ